METMVYINLPQSGRRMAISIQRLMQMFMYLPLHTHPQSHMSLKTYFKIFDRGGKGRNILLCYLTVGTVTFDCSELILSQKFVTIRGRNVIQLSYNL